MASAPCPQTPAPSPRRRCPSAAPPTSPDGLDQLQHQSASHTHPSPAGSARSPPAARSPRMIVAVLRPLPVSCSSAARYSSAGCCSSRNHLAQPRRPLVRRARSAAPLPAHAACRSAQTCVHPPCSGDTHRESPAHRCHETPAISSSSTPSACIERSATPARGPVRISGSCGHSAGPFLQIAPTAAEQRLDAAPRSPCPAVCPSAPSLQTPAAPPPDPAPHRHPLLPRPSSMRPPLHTESRLRRQLRSASIGRALTTPCPAALSIICVSSRRSINRACRKYTRIQYAASIFFAASRMPAGKPIARSAAASCACQSSTLSSRSCR